MNDPTIFKRIAAISAILSAPAALGASFVLILAIGGDPEIISNPVGILTLGDRVAGIFRWVEFVGMFGYSLLLIPATFYLWYWLKPRKPNLITLYTIIGLMSLTIGSIGSVILLSVWPPLMSAYVQGSLAQQEILSEVFRAFNDLVLVGLLPLSSMLSGVWSLGIGIELRAEKRILGIAALVLGVIYIAYAVGVNLQIEFLANLELFTFLGPIWFLWLGIVIYRREAHQSAFDPAERSELQSVS